MVENQTAEVGDKEYRVRVSGDMPSEYQIAVVYTQDDELKEEYTQMGDLLPSEYQNAWKGVQKSWFEEVIPYLEDTLDADVIHEIDLMTMTNRRHAHLVEDNE